MTSWSVTFQPGDLHARIEDGTLLTVAMKEQRIPIQLPCAGTGRCGKCIVEITPDAPEAGSFDRLHLSTDELGRGLRLACQTRVDRDMTVHISPSLRGDRGKILSTGESLPIQPDADIRKIYTVLPEPSLEDQTPDDDRLIRTLGIEGLAIDNSLRRDLPSLLREHEYAITAVIRSNRIITVEPGDTSGALFGIAFDVGTTTVVGTIHDLVTGKERGKAAKLNAQTAFGDDTISRIEYAISGPSGRTELQAAIRNTLNSIIDEAALMADIEATRIYEATVAGNTTMMHLLFGLDPEGLARVPFIPASTAEMETQARELGIGINPIGTVRGLPSIAGFVGADTVAVMLATGFIQPGPARLAIDIGTNGELALGIDDTIMVCSTAAGPALEGAALTSGMRATSGAVESIDVDGDDIRIGTIDDTRPVGICGSGVIDLVAALLHAGILAQSGAFETTEILAETIPPQLMERIITIDGQPAFLVSRGNGGTIPDVVFTQRDVRQVQLAKGAIAAGTHLLLNEMGIHIQQVHELLLAGAFGNYIRVESAQRIGLLPNIPTQRIRFVGNAASTGARMALLSRQARTDAETLRRRSRHLELAALPAFTEVLTDNMMFP